MGLLASREYYPLEASTECSPQSLATIPRDTPLPVAFVGLNEADSFFKVNIFRPIQHNRQADKQPYKLPVSRILSLIGRSSTGKRSLITSLCGLFKVPMHILQRPQEVLDFSLTDFIDGLTQPSILVIESTVAPISPNADTNPAVITQINAILDHLERLPADSHFKSVVFLLHNPLFFDMWGLCYRMEAKLHRMYARVPDYQTRFHFTLWRITRMSNDVNGYTYSKVFPETQDRLEAIAKLVANASAWYTIGELDLFLQTVYNSLLVGLIPKRDSDAPSQRMFEDYLMDYLRRTRDVVLARNKSGNFTVPTHPVYGERPYALDDSNPETLSRPFENYFNLRDVDVESVTWIHRVDVTIANDVGIHEEDSLVKRGMKRSNAVLAEDVVPSSNPSPTVTEVPPFTPSAGFERPVITAFAANNS